MADWERLNPLQRIDVLRSEIKQVSRDVERLEQRFESNDKQMMRQLSKVDEVMRALSALAISLERLLERNPA